MKNILCYGDSNTWGWNPSTKIRYERQERWTGVLSAKLGNNYHIIEEGLNGRTTVWDDPVDGGIKSGIKYLIPCLESHKPVDLLIIMLGTNDFKKRFSVSAHDIGRSMQTILDAVNCTKTGIEDKSPKVLLLCPPKIEKLDEYKYTFEGAEDKSNQLSYYYKKLAQDYKCHFFDTSQIIKSSQIDGIHLDKSEHIILGLKLAEIVSNILE